MDLRILVDDSDIGGDGGVAVAAISDVFIGGVANIGDDTVDGPGERSNISGVCGVDGVRCKGAGFLRRPPWDSAFRSLSCTISLSTFSSDNSVRRCWFSMRRFSRSFSPILISSSSNTLLSMAMLYFDSKSSRDEVV